MLKLNRCGCGEPKLVRVPRTGKLDALFAALGRYPWLCRHCDRRVYRKVRGSRKSKEAAQPAVE